MIPALSFNLGRILTYTVLGAVNGLVGQVLTKDLQIGSAMNVIIGILMVFVGLDMLRILPFDRILPNKWYKNFLLKMQGRLLQHPRQTSFLLGVITYWLPCGFTQSVQLYALSVADPVQSALIMLAFALGTTPVLLLMGYATSIMKTIFYIWFMKVIAVLVTLVGIAYILNFLTLYGLNPLQPLFSQLGGKVEAVAAKEENGEQIIRMRVTNSGYSPNSFTVEKGRPVKWIIDGVEVFGCQGYLVAPKIEVETTLKKGENIISFYPVEAGKIGFSCSMGMYGGEINVI
jgi:sulfite exporter TauE/SafE